MVGWWENVFLCIPSLPVIEVPSPQPPPPVLGMSPHLSLGGHCQSDTSKLKPCIGLQMGVTASPRKVIL